MSDANPDTDPQTPPEEPVFHITPMQAQEDHDLLSEYIRGCQGVGSLRIATDPATLTVLVLLRDSLCHLLGHTAKPDSDNTAYIKLMAKLRQKMKERGVSQVRRGPPHDVRAN